MTEDWRPSNHQSPTTNRQSILALTRAVPRSIQQCELTHLEREAIDYARAVAQHARYEAALAELGCRVVRLPDAPDLPDSVFVEDAAVVFDELAIITRPGAASRRPEVDQMTAALRDHRPLAFINEPGTLDGGDVLVTPGEVFVGISGRTNEDGVRQLRGLLAPHGFQVTPVPLTGCLHLKSGVTAVQPPGRGEKSAGASGAHGDASARHRPLLVINREWVDASYFAGFELIDVDPSEPGAANVLCIGDRVICAEEHPRTRALLARRGLLPLAVPAGELAKAEGGVTCCSVLVYSA